MVFEVYLLIAAVTWAIVQYFHTIAAESSDDIRLGTIFSVIYGALWPLTVPLTVVSFILLWIRNRLM